MKIGISNIAWEVSDDEAIADILCRRKIAHIDIAPGKYFPSPETATKAQATAIKEWWLERGIAIYGMQSLLFGTTGLNIFGGTTSRLAMITHLTLIFKIANWLGASKLTFGSPKNRDRQNLTDQEVDETACAFFGELAQRAADNNIVLCLEPNPTHYGANFLTKTPETADFVEKIDHPNIRMQLDLGTLIINQERLKSITDTYPNVVGHIHLSEKDLVPLGSQGLHRHAEFANDLLTNEANAVCTIEMLSNNSDFPLQTIEDSIVFAQNTYGG